MADDMPIGLKISKIHKFLQSELEAFSSEEILKATGIDIDSNSDILLSLTGEASKVLQEKDGKWRWASKYQVRDKKSLASLIFRSHDGINERDLYDSYKGVKNDIKALKADNFMFEIKSGSKVILFPRDPRVAMDISEEVQQRYRSVPLLADSIEIHKYLVSKGLKDTDDKNGVHIAQPVSRKRPSKKNGKRKNKKIKLTNTHMTGTNIDLTKDLEGGRNSAFN